MELRSGRPAIVPRHQWADENYAFIKEFIRPVGLASTDSHGGMEDISQKLLDYR